MRWCPFTFHTVNIYYGLLMNIARLLLCHSFAVVVAVTLADSHSVWAEPASGDAEGFASIFNGRDLAGWDGDPRFWSAADGVIRGQTTGTNRADHNTFLVWRGGQLKDFELKIQFRIEGDNNSGIQYRSREFEKWRIAGYQAEIINKPDVVGFLWNEQGKRKGVQVGQFVVYHPENDREVVGQIADRKALRESGHYRPGEWNQCHIIARGNHVIHRINGRQTVEFIDEDPEKAAREGLLALQVHGGKPLLVEFKDIRLKRLTNSFGDARVLFDGHSLDKWKVVPDEACESWSTVDGAIVTLGKPRGYLRTMEPVTDYVLRLQLKHFEPTNTGVLLRVQQPDRVWPKCMEAQGWNGTVGDIFGIGWKFDADIDRRYGDGGLDPTGRHVKTMHESNEGPLGSWIEYEIVNHGSDLELFVNGLLQNKAWNVEERPGTIALQAEGGKVAFRNLVLIPIGK